MILFTLRSKILMTFVLLFSIPLLSSMVIFNMYSTNFFKDSTKQLNINNMKYIGSSVNQAFKTVYDFSLYTITERNISQYLSTKETAPSYNIIKSEAQEVLSLLPFSNEYIKSVCVINNNGDYINSGREYVSLTQTEKLTLDRLKGFHYWNVERDTVSGEVRLFFSRRIRSLHNLQDNLGYLKIEVNMQSLMGIFTNVESEGNYYYRLADERNHIILSSYSDVKGELLPPEKISLESLDANLNTTFLLDGFYVTPYKIPSINWYVYSISSDEYTQEMQRSLLHVLLSSAIICFAVCFVLAMFFSKRITYPLKKLGFLMGSISNEDFSVRFNAKYSDEITVLATQFNAMSQKLETLYNEVYLSNIKLREAEFAELQAKINPHFLYNTLDTVYWMCKMHDADVSDMISALAKLFRLALSGSKDNIIPLSLELEHLNCYLYIQQVRYGGKLKYTIVNSLDPSNTMVMRLVMQPIIENAILHGIDAVGEGEIEISIHAEGDKLVYTISDTAGLADAQKINAMLDTASPAAGMGIKNINDRIKLKFSKEDGIHCAVVDSKTVFTITQPLTRLTEETGK